MRPAITLIRSALSALHRALGGGHYLLPLAILGVGLPLAWGVGMLDVQHRRAELRGDVRLQLSAVVAQAQSQIRLAFSKTEGLTQLISVDGTITEAHFHGMADRALASVPYLHHLAIAPNDVITDVYPHEGNEAALGLDYRTLPAQYKTVQRAHELGHTLLSGPAQLRQGGIALIYRRPVFLSGHSGRQQYWGVLSVITDVDGLLKAAGILDHHHLDLALRGADGLGADGAMIWGPSELFSAQSVLADIEIPGGQWQIAAQPHGGWPNIGLSHSWLFLAAFTATLLFTGFAALLSRSHVLVQRRNVALKVEIGERQVAEAELERMALYDAVTGLPNRTLFHQRLGRCIEAVQHRGGFMAVMLLDIDGFKVINDTLGHALGDELLRQATRRLAEQVRPWDTLARLGGDEFAFILDRLSHPADSGQVVQRLLQAMQQPFDLDGNTALVSASIGVAICPADGGTALDLLRHADTAMYSAKEAGRNDFRYYQPSMTSAIQERVAVEHALRRALAYNEFEVWYQPKLDLASGRVDGAEALLRWRDPVVGMVFPDVFIPVAERTGLIIPIGQWVLDHVCAQVRQWRDRGLFDGRVAVNVAAPQIDRSDFVASVSRALKAHGLPGSALEVEVTESLLMESQEHACQVLASLRGLGVRTAIDDFGTGHSSLAYLKLLPVDHLKIDRAFIRDLPADQTYAEITRAIVALGRALAFNVTAEGIETQAQLDFLRLAGCASGQGYHIGRPMPAADFEQWLAEQRRSLRPQNA
ncbi:EAL domain-containing protein [Pseudomonas sp. NPDC007930]|uniref:putative bifunctional diguanylate cyclase/phosphodiesterase n=1 Tax=Pseudomonas sp. NPDC007930 TaxID=3364417 RepID=UPI0036EA0855